RDIDFLDPTVDVSRQEIAAVNTGVADGGGIAASVDMLILRQNGVAIVDCAKPGLRGSQRFAVELARQVPVIMLGSRPHRHAKLWPWDGCQSLTQKRSAPDQVQRPARYS